MSESAVASIALSFAALLFSLTVHEASHAWTASRLGDATARALGRVSLNPLVHLDPVGTVLLPAVAFFTGAPILGWAKPVPVNAMHLARPRLDFALIASAGPLSNIGLALMASLALRQIDHLPDAVAGLATAVPLRHLAWTLFEVNLSLAVFNLIPVPPLDGGNMLGGVLPVGLARLFDVVRPYGVIILYALMLSGVLNALMAPPYTLLARLLTL